MSDDSSDSDDTPNFKKQHKKKPALLYRERPEWADVTGVPQVEAAEPVCPILYSPEFADTMNYFRAIVRRSCSFFLFSFFLLSADAIRFGSTSGRSERWR